MEKTKLHGPKDMDFLRSADVISRSSKHYALKRRACIMTLVP